jgi:hypothetical protein
MNLSRTLRRGLQGIVLMVVVLLSVNACGGESEPDPAPGVDLDGLLSGAGENMAASTTVKFNMVDVDESGAKFFGTTLKSLEAEVKAPDSFKMVVDVEAPGFGFVEIEMVAVGEQAFLKFSKDSPWNPLPLDEVPFNFAGLGLTLRDLLATIKDGAVVTGRESLGGVEAIVVEAEIASDELLSLVSTADSGHDVALTLWIDEAEHNLRRVRIAGRIFDDDDSETVRHLNILGIDVPVEIQIPDVGSGS